MELSDQFVSGTVHGDDDFRMGTVILDFLPYLQNKIIYRPRRDRFVVPPDVCQQVVPADGLIAVLPEIFQDLKLFRRHGKLFPMFRTAVTGEMNLDIAEVHRRIAGTVRYRAAQKCIYTRDEFAQAEWFRDVIIRAKLQSEYLIDFLNACGQHQYGNRVGSRVLASQ